MRDSFKLPQPCQGPSLFPLAEDNSLVGPCVSPRWQKKTTEHATKIAWSWSLCKTKLLGQETGQNLPKIVPLGQVAHSISSLADLRNFARKMTLFSKRMHLWAQAMRHRLGLTFKDVPRSLHGYLITTWKKGWNLHAAVDLLNFQLANWKLRPVSATQLLSCRFGGWGFLFLPSRAESCCGT